MAKECWLYWGGNCASRKRPPLPRGSTCALDGLHFCVLCTIANPRLAKRCTQNHISTVLRNTCCCYGSFARPHCVRLAIVIASKRLQVEVQSNTQNRKFAVWSVIHEVYHLISGLTNYACSTLIRPGGHKWACVRGVTYYARRQLR